MSTLPPTLARHPKNHDVGPPKSRIKALVESGEHMVPDTNLGSKGNNARNGLGYHRTGSAVDKAPISIGPYLVEHRQVKMSMSVNRHNMRS